MGHYFRCLQEPSELSLFLTRYDLCFELAQRCLRWWWGKERSIMMVRVKQSWRVFEN